MPTYYSYVITRDYGFAPNPFGRECTLATCKPQIRKFAVVGDWVFGTTSVAGNRSPKLVFAMEVTGKTDFNSYYSDPIYQYKKPVMNGSLKKMYGDNIYHSSITQDGAIQWLQDDSHHSLKDGTTNIYNLERDTNNSDSVLVSDHFYYLGKEAMDIPSGMVNAFCKKGPAYRTVDELDAQRIIRILTCRYSKGFVADPAQFRGTFKRYNGK
ncbi:hypothetical protein [Desulfoluna spongiiphila]|uniref:Nucleotide modification associated domain-containing protein n=1 Tax=Desulfoluna spongiiphila TaxID=419481 RepID=A0A1G5JRW8_9BACT|nr:hypothetical protein [Desulfoluna spongiiphila]SCY90600.1 hypothetical protein SAMN05216233_14012 [Desulfoluna spongiiphila]